ncbi:MAG: crossover junction endodeoxyribonuclease RuvC [Nitrososphaerales archaeon]
MLVLGIDPGIGTTGYGVVGEDARGEVALVAYGAIETAPGAPMPERLQRLYSEMTDILLRYQPESVAVEQLFFGRNVTTAIMVGQARGVVLLAAAQAGLAVYEYKPAEVKQALSGYGNADKRQMQEMVKLLLHLDQIPRPDDAADAVAVAVCHFHSARLRRLAE